MATVSATGQEKVQKFFDPLLHGFIHVPFNDAQALRQAVSEDLIPQSLMDPNQVGQVRLMLVGAGLILLLVFRPQGLLGDRRELILEPS